MNKYLAKIIANDQEGLQMISACSSGAKVKIADIKYLASNKVFLLSIERTRVESDQEHKKINSICRFDFVDKVRSKNIDQSKKEVVLTVVLPLEKFFLPLIALFILVSSFLIIIKIS